MEANKRVAGVVFPVTEGRRSTAALGRAVLADAVRDLDEALARDIAAEQDWRRGYIKAFRRLTELYLRSPQAAYGIARRGLDSAHDRFRFVRGEQEWGLGEATEQSPGRQLHTGGVKGDPSTREHDLAVPYRGGVLAGDTLRAQVDRWAVTGVAEPSFAEAIRSVLAHPEWLDLRDQTFLVLGAGAELGPFKSLLRWGAHVIAADLPMEKVWARLLNEARHSAGHLSFPVPTPLSELSETEIARNAGVDIVRDLDKACAWMSSFAQPLTIGNYMYAEGAQHLRCAVAADALISAQARSRTDIAVAFLSTPTDVFAVPRAVVEDSRRRGANTRRWHTLVRGVSGGRLFSPNYPGTLPYGDGDEVGLCDSLVPIQGPNYALAKRIQRWRAMVASAEGGLVSHNVAPASRTKSVLKNRALAAAYAGAHRFGVEIFDPSTSNTLMAALLVHDLRNPAPSLSRERNPVELFWSGANHGGIWRNPYAPRSVLSAAVGLGLPVSIASWRKNRA